MYTDIIKELIVQQKDTFERAKAGDFSRVCYQEQWDEEKGKCDKNYTNRLRLVYYILFEKIDNEEIIKRLFEEELKDRETNSFQGIGPSLEMLTYLLMKYNDNGKYNDLFTRAKNANFDCACGYDSTIEIPSGLEQYDICACIQIAIEMESVDCVKELVEQWKESVSVWQEQDYRSLIRFNQFIHNEEENEEPFKMLLDLACKKGENTHIISAWHNLIHYYVQSDQCAQAYKELTDMINRTKLSEIYNRNLFNFILEDCLDLICKYDEKSVELWKWAKPFVKKKSGNMYGNLYEKSIKAAKKVNSRLVEKLSMKYHSWKERISSVSEIKR